MVLVSWPHFAALSIGKLPRHSYQLIRIKLSEFFFASVVDCKGVWRHLDVPMATALKEK